MKLLIVLVIVNILASIAMRLLDGEYLSKINIVVSIIVIVIYYSTGGAISIESYQLPTPEYRINEEQTGVCLESQDGYAIEYRLRTSDYERANWKKYSKNEIIIIDHDPTWIDFRSRYLWKKSETVEQICHINKYGQVWINIEPDIPLLSINASYLAKESTNNQFGNTYAGYGITYSDLYVVGIDSNGDEIELKNYSFSPGVLMEGENTIEIEYVTDNGQEYYCSVTVFAKTPVLSPKNEDFTSESNTIVAGIEDRPEANGNYTGSGTANPIIDNPINIDAITSIEKTVPSLIISNFSGSVSSDGQNNDHRFSPVVSGTYRFEFADIADGVDFRLWICNSNGDVISSDYDMDTGDGITIALDSGSTYIIRVGQYRNTGSYNLIIGEQKPTVDISNYTKISDSIQYTDQENNYIISPSISGTYRFEFSDVPDGTDLRLYVFNSGWETIKSDYDLDNGDGLTVTLEAGKSYYIQTKQYRKLGEYSLIIGKQKETVDVTSNTMLSDSIQYTNQGNNYKLVAAIAGIYRFEFANVPEGTDFRLNIYNSGWESIMSDYDLDTGDGLTVSLSEGQEIYITVSQYRSLGTYSLVLGQPKPTVEISDFTQISDSVQYTEQRNVYLFEAKTSGKYSFTFSGVPDGVDYRMRIYNSGWETIQSDYDMDSGDGLSVELAQGQKIYVCVSQFRSTGVYTMVISRN